MSSLLTVYFQPIWDLWTRTVVGYEALVRGQRADRVISAHEVFREAGEHGGAVAVDAEARRMALERLSYLPQETRLFVNLLPKTVETIAPHLWFPRGARLERIVVEVSERTKRAERLQQGLTPLRLHGLQVALDDYGVERTNLHLLEVLQPEWIKLDLSFVREGRWELIRSLRRFVEDWPGMHLIVEGVESKVDIERCLDAGVRYMQGFALGIPLPLTDALRVEVDPR
ncbi:EAL domain-containing protein [Alicyclobacillus acidocaldarius]|uniref:Diguanylate phosphodiesterase n=1 Tax=Alicyclobacillus acidocaldarius subsp. acidocaldarius (strain ATCC 27009 / DSM 446 / BCRC 14685 / JCM 5260 / KCTC 1825 / NBRC 15652 / NCIMB 11725 / NRRL B-14509 / 104-IA) TaxID=521098 RepID=C8WSY2_ALIAD|nr:EAL domain-containing protein [Alicyclobacillus acidocaldarius]ACV57638.1 diguanylate phosphodiesterase [Alicyclobacillus acidocaldarius subsp. acidocaldarius DSM 446]ACV60130.1 diguanylate phosphodiesterase [Alicyclobacillus acidocaldarius subsp. acidocaldarius DSM 446]